MKTKLLTALCILLAVCCVVLSAFVVLLQNDGENTTPPQKTTAPEFADATSTDIQFKLSLLHVYSEALQLTSTLPYATVQLTYAALTKAFTGDSNSVSYAVDWLNKYVDKQVMSAYDTMDDILAKYKSVLDKYNITSSSPYTAKYESMKSLFASLKNSSVELISRTRSLILVSHSSSYDSSYTLYMEQLSDITTKIQDGVVVLTNEYEALLESISNDYDIIK